MWNQAFFRFQAKQNFSFNFKFRFQSESEGAPYPTPYNLRESTLPPCLWCLHPSRKFFWSRRQWIVHTHTHHHIVYSYFREPSPLPLYTMTSDDPIRSRTRALYPVVSGARAVEATPWADLTAGRPPPGAPQWPPRRTHSIEKKGWGSEAAVQQTYRHNRELKISDKAMIMLK